MDLLTRLKGELCTALESAYSNIHLFLQSQEEKARERQPWMNETDDHKRLVEVTENIKRRAQSMTDKVDKLATQMERTRNGLNAIKALLIMATREEKA